MFVKAVEVLAFFNIFEWRNLFKEVVVVCRFTKGFCQSSVQSARPPFVQTETERDKQEKLRPRHKTDADTDRHTNVE